MRKLFILLLSILLIGIVTAQPPFQQTTASDTVVIVESPVIEYIKLAQDFQFHAHAHSGTDGEILTNLTSNCTIHLYSPNNGEHLVEQLMDFDDNNFDFKLDVLGTNFTEIGQYSAYIYCDYNGTDLGGGFLQYPFYVNPLGEELTVAKTIQYSVIFLFSILLFFGFLILGIYLPSENNRDKVTGYILYVSNIKYLKYLLLGLAYICTVWISYLAWMISYSFLDMTFLTTILKFFFYLLAICTLPMFILYVYLTISNLIRDSNVRELLERGIKTR